MLQVAPQEPELFVLVLLYFAQPTHEVADCADERGGRDEGPEGDDDATDHLQRVRGFGLAGSHAELGECPVHARQVLVLLRLRLHVQVRYPILGLQTAGGEPSACDQVVQDQQVRNAAEKAEVEARSLAGCWHTASTHYQGT